MNFHLVHIAKLISLNKCCMGGRVQTHKETMSEYSIYYEMMTVNIFTLN